MNVLASSTLQGYSLDKSSFTPLYIQVRDILKELINNYQLKPGDRIPSENELTAAFDISRMTVRQALQELTREGLLYVRRGEGTFVNHAPHTQMLLKLEGFSTEMNRLGYKARSELLEIKKIESYDKHELAYTGLGIEAGEPLIYIRRVRILESAPFALETYYLPHRYGADLLKKGMPEDTSIYRYLENVHKVLVSQADHSIQPGLATERVARRLGIKVRTPILRLRGTTYSTEHQPVEYLEGFYRGEPYELKVVVTKERD